MRPNPSLLLSLACALCFAPATHADDGWEVRFVNNSPYQVSIWVDNNFVCTLQPGSNCSTKVEDDVTHQVHVTNTNDQTYDDSFESGECFDEVETYTFIPDHVEFSCT